MVTTGTSKLVKYNPRIRLPMALCKPLHNEVKIRSILARLMRKQQKHSTTTFDYQIATKMLRRQSSVLSSELHESLRWGDTSRQDSLERKLRQVHDDLIVLRGRTAEASSGARQVLLAKSSAGGQPSHHKGGHWLHSARRLNKERTEANRVTDLRKDSTMTKLALTPKKRRPTSAHPRSNQPWRPGATKGLSKSPQIQRPQSAHSTRGEDWAQTHSAAGTEAFEQLQQESNDTPSELLVQLKKARNDGLHGNGGNQLSDPAKGELVQKLKVNYEQLYPGVHGKLDILLER